MSGKWAPPRRPMQLDDLDDRCLQAVFRLVPADERRALPRVCRRWAQLCDSPAVWEDVSLNFSNGKIEDKSAMYKWCVKRRGTVKHLKLIVESEDDWMAAHLVLGLLAKGLTSLIVRKGLDGMEMQSCAWMAVLHNLKRLSMRYDVPRTMEQCAVFPPGLEVLRLRPSGVKYLRSLPVGLSKLTALQQLALPGVDLVTDEEDGNRLAPLCRLTALQHINLSCSRLMDLPPGLTALTLLSSLNLSGCEMIASMGSALGPLAALTQVNGLDLSDCRLTDLPAPVAALPALRELLLNENSLESLPQGAYLACLERLNLDENNFSALPDVLFKCTRLTQLRAADGNMENAPQMTITAKQLWQLLTNNPNLRQLRLSNLGGVGSSSQLAKLMSKFPKVKLVKAGSEDDDEFGVVELTGEGFDSDLEYIGNSDIDWSDAGEEDEEGEEEWASDGEGSDDDDEEEDGEAEEEEEA